MALPVREYFYKIDARGRVYHDGVEIADPRFLKFFLERITPNTSGLHADYPYVSPCAGEMNYIRSDLTPIVFQSLKDDRMFYGPDLFVPFEPDVLRFSESGLFHPAPACGFAALSGSLAMELSRCIEPWGDYFALRESSSEPIHVIEPLVLPKNLVVLRSDPNGACFGCGGGNPVGLGLPFLFDMDRVEARGWFSAPSWMAGHPSWMHGGFVSLLLDEVAAKILRGLNKKGATVNLAVSFHKPCPIGAELELKSRLLDVEGRKIRIEAEIYSGDTRCASAEALFIEILNAS